MRGCSAPVVVCFKCHTDKAGPFAFRHAPDRTEGRVACHTPGGSSIPHLLKRSQVKEDPGAVAQDLIVPRNFRGTLEMVSLRYAS